MSDTSADATDRGNMKYCRQCGQQVDESNENIVEEALDHWIRRHPRSDTLHEIVTSAWVQVDCQDCGQAFFSPLSYFDGRIGADAYCPDCDGEGIRKLMVQDLSPADVAAREVDPTEDDLDNRRVFDIE